MAEANEPPAAGSKSEGVSAVRDATIGAAARTLAAGALTVDAFAYLAAEAGLYEIKAAEIALRRTRRDDIRAFAEQMLKDHKDIAAKLGSFLGGMERPNSPPEKLDKLQQTLIDDLEGASDEDFDHRYLSQQIATHDTAITLFKSYHKHGDDEGLKNLAGLGLPVLERHRATAKTLAGSG